MKRLQTDQLTNGRTDRQVQSNMPPLFRKGGHKYNSKLQQQQKKLKLEQINMWCIFHFQTLM